MRRMLAVMVSATALIGASLIAAPLSHAQETSGIYFSTISNGVPSIGRVNLDGSSPIVDLIPVDVAYDIAVHGDSVYWATSTGVSMTTPAGARPGVISNVFSFNVTKLNISGNFMYYLDGTTVGKVGLDGTGAQQVTSSSTNTFLAVNDAHIYYGSAGHEIHRLNKDLTGDTVVSGSYVLPGDGSFTLTSDHLYFSTSSLIGRMPLDGSSAVEVLVNRNSSGFTNERGLATDGTYLYWVSQDASLTKYISRAKLDGSELVNTFISNVGSPHSLAVHLVDQLAHTITFNPAPTISVRYTESALGATSSAGLPVTYESLTTNVCTVKENIARFVQPGLCTITASSPASGDYQAATPVTKSFTIEPLPGPLAKKCASNGSCANADLSNIRISNINMSHVNFRNADLRNSILNNVIADNTNFISVEMSNVQIINSTINSSNFNNARITNSYIKATTFIENNFSNSNLSNSDVSNAFWNQCQMQNSNWSGATNADGGKRAKKSRVVKFTGSNLTKANFAKANLPGANFAKSTLTKANFTKGNFAKANFKGAIAKGMKTTGANLSGAKGLKK